MRGNELLSLTAYLLALRGGAFGLFLMMYDGSIRSSRRSRASSKTVRQASRTGTSGGLRTRPSAATASP